VGEGLKFQIRNYSSVTNIPQPQFIFKVPLKLDNSHIPLSLGVGTSMTVKSREPARDMRGILSPPSAKQRITALGSTPHVQQALEVFLPHSQILNNNSKVAEVRDTLSDNTIFADTTAR
jgi:hypothetical protein